MARITDPMQVYRLLNQSNCRKCNEKTCLAFAAAVFKGERSLSECPELDADTIAEYGDANKGKGQKAASDRIDVSETVEKLREKVRQTDLPAAAERLGARFEKDRITVKVMGKDFSVDAQGRVYTEIHVNPWVTVPVFDYIVNGKGTPPSGKWVPLRELKGGRERLGLFEQRCEKPLKKIADNYTDLFNDMLDIFDGKRTETRFDADTAVVLYPLPRVPMLICYWEPEEELESSLKVFFDKVADDNLSIASVYTLGAGLVQMFEKLAFKHAG